MSLDDRDWYRRQLAQKLNAPLLESPVRFKRRRWSTDRIVALIVGTTIVVGFALMDERVRDLILPEVRDGWQPGVHCPGGSHAIKREISLTGVLETTCMENR